MESIEQEKINKESYYDYASHMWMKNKNRYINNDGTKGGYFYTCKKEGCKEARVLNKVTDPEYEIKIKSDYCESHKMQDFGNPARKL